MLATIVRRVLTEGTVNFGRGSNVQGAQLTPADAKYGTYYLSASRLNFAEEDSPALLLLWTREQTGWGIVAWAVEVP